MKYTGEQAMATGTSYDVLCDGVELNHVHECDDEAGYAIISALDENGHLIIDGDEVRTKWVWGKIEVKERSAPSTITAPWPPGYTPTEG